MRLNGLRSIVATVWLIVALTGCGTSAPGAPNACGADQIIFPAMRDTTLYGSQSDISNGAGDHLFVGTIKTGGLRRALVAFDLESQVPPGSDITCAALVLRMSRTVAGPQEIEIHLALASWGEGASEAEGREGKGAPAEPNDATWTDRFAEGLTWASPGGDFDTSPTATAMVNGEGQYLWGPTDRLTADVQQWLDQPESNNGWILIGNETLPKTAKRFNAREFKQSTQPSLVVTYVPTG